MANLSRHRRIGQQATARPGEIAIVSPSLCIHLLSLSREVPTRACILELSRCNVVVVVVVVVLAEANLLGKLARHSGV